MFCAKSSFYSPGRLMLALKRSEGFADSRWTRKASSVACTSVRLESQAAPKSLRPQFGNDVTITGKLPRLLLLRRSFASLPLFTWQQLEQLYARIALLCQQRSAHVGRDVRPIPNRFCIGTCPGGPDAPQGPWQAH